MPQAFHPNLRAYFCIRTDSKDSAAIKKRTAHKHPGAIKKLYPLHQHKPEISASVCFNTKRGGIAKY